MNFACWFLGLSLPIGETKPLQKKLLGPPLCEPLDSDLTLNSDPTPDLDPDPTSFVSVSDL